MSEHQQAKYCVLCGAFIHPRTPACPGTAWQSGCLKCALPHDPSCETEAFATTFTGTLQSIPDAVLTNIELSSAVSALTEMQNGWSREFSRHIEKHHTINDSILQRLRWLFTGRINAKPV